MSNPEPHSIVGDVGSGKAFAAKQNRWNQLTRSLFGCLETTCRVTNSFKFPPILVA